MNLVDWIFSPCGSSYFGIYTCYTCGNDLLWSGLDKSLFVKKEFTLKGFLPPATIAAKTSSREDGASKNKSEMLNTEKNNISVHFNSASMLEDFTMNWNLGKMFRKDAVIRNASDFANSYTKYKMLCGKCGSSLGRHFIDEEGHSRKPYRVNLTFRKS